MEISACWKIAPKMNRQLAAMLPAVALSLLPGQLAAQGSQIVDITLPDVATSTAIQQIDLSELPISDGLFGGTWDSSFGELKLIQTDNVVIGDYGSVGILLGEAVTPDCLAGVFTNGAQYGQFSFRISEAGRFSGVYRFGEGWRWSILGWHPNQCADPQRFRQFQCGQSGHAAHLQ
jgi:hypothetical protein